MTQKSFTFKKNKKADIIRLDDNYFDFKYDNETIRNFNVHDINFYYLIKSLFLFALYRKKIKDLYIISVIKSYNPKIIIGHHIELIIFKIKELIPEITTIVYQHNVIWDSQIVNYKNKYNGFKCDYFIVYDKRSKKIFSDLVDATYHISGSVKNNSFSISNRKEKIYDIMYISEFRNYPQNHFRSKVEKFIVNVLSEYCNKSNKKLCIALASNRSEKKNKLNIDDELRFFNYEQNNFYYNNESSYKLAQKSELSVCVSSNLGPELLARGSKVLFLSILELFDKSLRHPYYDANSLIFYCGLDQELIKKKIDYLLNLDKFAYKKLVKDSNIMIGYDKDNKVLKKIIKERI